MSRYSRHISLKEIGIAGQDKINASKVLVIGAGGLGCPILQYLVAAGVGTIGIVDFDVVDVSNLQRQILFGTSSIGKNKAEVAKDELHHLNPTININAYSKKLTPKTVVSIIKPYDIVVDATDNFASRYLINDATVLLEKPSVLGAFCSMVCGAIGFILFRVAFVDFILPKEVLSLMLSFSGYVLGSRVLDSLGFEGRIVQAISNFYSVKYKD